MNTWTDPGWRIPMWVVAAAAGFCLWQTGWSGKAKAETTNAPAGASSSTGATRGLPGFRVKPGFRIELVATAPMVAAPVAMAFDENGRLFVAEMRDYPDRREEKPHPGRVRLLEETGEEGMFDASRVFADDLPWPSAVACYGGGIFVAATPDILYLKSTTAQGTADVRQVVFSGFGGTNTPRADGLLNNFKWGLDHRIHGATAGIGGVVRAAGAADSAGLSLAGSDFVFDPRALMLMPETGPAQSGLSFDNWGRKFICDLARPLRLPMYEQRYAARNPFFPEPSKLLDVASPATPIFRWVRVGPLEPAGAELLSTNQGPARGARETNVLGFGWLTNAHACVVYNGSAFPTNYLNNVFVADPSAHVIHRLMVRESGLGAVAERAPDERNTEFVVSSDSSFRPMQLVNGPDGALYIADFCEGRDSGRIYRIVPEGFRSPKRPQLGGASVRELVTGLAHTNGWHRETAARLLYERQALAAVPLLTNMLHSRVPLVRLQALSALESLGSLREAQALTALRDRDERVREAAVLAAERLAGSGGLSEAVWNQLRTMALDPAPRVRRQLAFTLGELRGRERIPVLATILARDPDNRWIQAAVLSSLAQGAGEMFRALGSDARFRGSAAGGEFLWQLAAMIGVQGKPEEVSQVLEFIDRTALEPGQVFAWLYALGDGLHRTRSSLALVDAARQLRRFYADALSVATTRGAAVPLRMTAIRLVGEAYTFADAGDLLLLLFGSGEPPAVQSAAIAALGSYNDPRVAWSLIARWPVLAPPLRQEAVVALLTWSDRIGAVMDALERGRIRPEDVPPAQVNFLRTYRDPSIRARAVRLLGAMPLYRPEAVKQFQPALHLKGAARTGREVFRARCAACHRLGGEGTPLGPDLVAAKISGKEKLLQAILEPNAEVRPGYQTYVAESKERENLIGLVGDDNLHALTLRQPYGVERVWPRENLRAIEVQPWSLMPAGLERGLDARGMADLLEYLMTVQR